MPNSAFGAHKVVTVPSRSSSSSVSSTSVPPVQPNIFQQPLQSKGVPSHDQNRRSLIFGPGSTVISPSSTDDSFASPVFCSPVTFPLGSFRPHSPASSASSDEDVSEDECLEPGTLPRTSSPTLARKQRDASSSSDGEEDEEEDIKTLSSALFGTTPDSELASSPSSSTSSVDLHMQGSIASLSSSSTSDLEEDLTSKRKTKTGLEKYFKSSMRIHDLPHTTNVSLAQCGMSDAVSIGSVINDPSNATRTLFVLPSRSSSTRDSQADKEARKQKYIKRLPALDTPTICSLLEHAEDHLNCTGIVFVLDKRAGRKELGSLLHQLMYVGGVIVSESVWKARKDYLLVGLDL